MQRNLASRLAKTGDSNIREIRAQDIPDIYNSGERQHNTADLKTRETGA
jgi:hypothetical protein